MGPPAKTAPRGSAAPAARRAALVAAALVSSACQSLAALECPGGASSCPDASARDDGGGAGGDAATGIACLAPGEALDGASGPTAYCTPQAEECCYRTGPGPTTVQCQVPDGGCPTDIFCDDPAQCPNGTCWMCLDDAGDLLGVGCQKDQFGCGNGTSILPLCSASGDCSGGRTCAPQEVADFPAGWFKTCQ